MFLSELIGKKALILGTDFTIGDCVLDKHGTRLTQLVLFGDDGEYGLNVKYVKKWEPIRFLDVVEFEPLLPANNPILKDLVSESGRLLGRIRDLEIKGGKVITVIMSKDLSVGRGSLIFDGSKTIFVKAKKIQDGDIIGKNSDEISVKDESSEMTTLVVLTHNDKEQLTFNDKEQSPFDKKNESEQIESEQIYSESSAEEIGQASNESSVEKIEQARDENNMVDIEQASDGNSITEQVRSKNSVDDIEKLDSVGSVEETEQVGGEKTEMKPIVAVVSTKQPSRLVSDYSFLLGRHVTKKIELEEDMFINVGEVITNEIVDKAFEHNKLYELTLKSRS